MKTLKDLLLLSDPRLYEKCEPVLPSELLQHEYDHLDGILYPMRIRDFTRFGFQDVLFPGQAVVDD